MNKFKKIVNIIVATIYPNKCLGCGKILDDDNYLCKECNAKIERNDLEKICLNCGLEDHDCVCKYNVYRFNSLITVFKNQGVAQKICYNYKFKKRQHYVRFFAKEICNAVCNCYDNIEFDFVCAVPSFDRFGFDHSGYIARAVAKKLNLPFYNNMLQCVKKTKKQHKSSYKERLSNVDDKYCTTQSISTVNVLLIDDIKTTGATLDECAKQLLFAGADSVYCVSVLGSVTNIEK